MNSFIHQNQILLPEILGFCKQHSNSLILLESPTCSPMALVLENTLRHPMIQDGLMDCCTNLSQFSEFFSGRQPLEYLNFLPDFLLFLFKSYLESRTFTVQLNDSSPKPTPSGLPQDDMPHPPHTHTNTHTIHRIRRRHSLSTSVLAS